MASKQEKQRCWNCDGPVSLQILQCPYCGVALARSSKTFGSKPTYEEFSNPFQSTQSAREASLSEDEEKNTDTSLHLAKKGEEETFNTSSPQSPQESEQPTTPKQELSLMLLLLPGIVFFLFGLALLLFSRDGLLTLRWNQNIAYFYLVGALPLLYFSWRACR